MRDIVSWFAAVRELERRLGVPVVSNQTKLERLGISVEEYEREIACLRAKYLLD